MKKYLLLVTLIAPILANSSCKQKTSAANIKAAADVTDLSELAKAVPTTGPREGNNYKFFFKALRQDQSPAVGFKVDAWVKGKSEPKTLRTDKNGIVKFEDLPFPDASHQVNVSLHYYKGQEDSPREINYPFLETDAYRMKDTQYIPNIVATDPQ